MPRTLSLSKMQRKHEKTKKKKKKSAMITSCTLIYTVLLSGTSNRRYYKYARLAFGKKYLALFGQVSLERVHLCQSKP